MSADKTNTKRQAGFRQRLRDRGGKVATVYLEPGALSKLKDSPLTQSEFINRAILAYKESKN